MSGKYNHPPASSPSVRRRMQRQRRDGTACELAVRSAVHALGLRYRLHQRPLPHFRRRADLVFRRAKVAVFVDGCFWHGCPKHGSKPKTHSKWWREKIRKNRERDAETNVKLKKAGWVVIRIWEHESSRKAAGKIERAVRKHSLKG